MQRRVPERVAADGGKPLGQRYLLQPRIGKGAVPDGLQSGRQRHRSEVARVDEGLLAQRRQPFGQHRRTQPRTGKYIIAEAFDVFRGGKIGGIEQPRLLKGAVLHDAQPRPEPDAVQRRVRECALPDLFRLRTFDIADIFRPVKGIGGDALHGVGQHVFRLSPCGRIDDQLRPVFGKDDAVLRTQRLVLRVRRKGGNGQPRHAYAPHVLPQINGADGRRGAVVLQPDLRKSFGDDDVLLLLAPTPPCGDARVALLEQHSVRDGERAALFLQIAAERACKPHRVVGDGSKAPVQFHIFQRAAARKRARTQRDGGALPRGDRRQVAAIPESAALRRRPPGKIYARDLRLRKSSVLYARHVSEHDVGGADTFSRAFEHAAAVQRQRPAFAQRLRDITEVPVIGQHPLPHGIAVGAFVRLDAFQSGKVAHRQIQRVERRADAQHLYLLFPEKRTRRLKAVRVQRIEHASPQRVRTHLRDAVGDSEHAVRRFPRIQAQYAGAAAVDAVLPLLVNFGSGDIYRYDRIAER